MPNQMQARARMVENGTAPDEWVDQMKQLTIKKMEKYTHKNDMSRE
jgi:membrane-bound lytic murein transglycosylase MltF